MKKMIILFTALAMIAGFSTISLAGIQGEMHDLSDNGLGSSEICVFCHVPHNPVDELNGGPLWNHTVTTQTFTLYDASTTTASGISALCLSCHDGTTFVDAFGGNVGATTITTINAAADIGLDLTDDHPVMMAYPTDWATTGDFNDPGALSSGQVFSGNVECASCHDPHDQSTYGKFLRADNAGSALCLDCHNK